MKNNTSSGKQAIVKELDPVVVQDDDKTNRTIRIFQVELNGVLVELCSLGASITRILVPSSSKEDYFKYDDLVLGFDSINEMYQSKNPVYFGVIPGRVANRIRQGKFQTISNGNVYQLDINNPPNHLHGGLHGFSNCIWDTEIIISNDENSCIKFTYISHNGDQHYPGTIRVCATYKLMSTPCNTSVRIVVDLSAELLDDIPTPINLTQHTYFNLAGHDNNVGILDHKLRLYCDSYTPIDETSIPTREVQLLSKDPIMDWRSSRYLQEALKVYGITKIGLSVGQVDSDLADRSTCLTTTPYGFDHNYVVRQQYNAESSDSNSRDNSSRDALRLVAELFHPKTQRRLTVRSNAPGVQLYTANYLDGTLPKKMKSPLVKTGYTRWQGLCLETQSFPDSILVDNDTYPEFAKGQCQILTPSNPLYKQNIEYTIEYHVAKDENDRTSPNSFHGTDSNDQHYYSVDEMWEELGVTDNDNSSSWYECTAAYYKDNCPPTVDGVLGGFATITDIDIKGSLDFVHELMVVRPSFRFDSNNNVQAGTTVKRRACECGAGLGRVTKGLLSKINGIDQIDLIESSSTLLLAAPDYLGDTIAGRCRYFCAGLQDWEPTPNTYSIIWIQWVLSYLTDTDIIKFFHRCCTSLTEDGIIILKENNCAASDFEIDLDDASVTRSKRYWGYLFKCAGLRIVHVKEQEELPDDIYPVTMFALELDTTNLSE